MLHNCYFIFSTDRHQFGHVCKLFCYIAKDSSLIKNNQFLTNLLKVVAISPIAAPFFLNMMITGMHIGCGKKMTGNLSSRSRLCHVLVVRPRFFYCKWLKTPVFNICLVLKKNPARDALKRNHSLYILCKIAMQQFGYKCRCNG